METVRSRRRSRSAEARSPSRSSAQTRRRLALQKRRRARTRRLHPDAVRRRQGDSGGKKMYKEMAAQNRAVLADWTGQRLRTRAVVSAIFMIVTTSTAATTTAGTGLVLMSTYCAQRWAAANARPGSAPLPRGRLMPRVASAARSGKKQRCGDAAGAGGVARKKARSRCPHDRERSKCKGCEGGGHQHQRRRSKCKECGGAGICPHQRRRSRCKECHEKADEVDAGRTLPPPPPPPCGARRKRN